MLLHESLHHGGLLLLFPHPVEQALHLCRHSLWPSITISIDIAVTIIITVSHDTSQHRLVLAFQPLHQPLTQSQALSQAQHIPCICTHHLRGTAAIHQHHIRPFPNREAIISSKILFGPLLTIIVIRTTTIPQQLLLVIVQFQLKPFK